MKIRTRQDLSAGFIFLGCGAVFVLGSGKYTIGTLDEMGPGFLPLCVGLLQGIVGSFLIARSLLAGGDVAVELHALPQLLVSAAICAFALVLPPLGLVAAIVVLTVIAARASPEFRVIEALLLSLFLAALSAALFVYGLGLPLALWPSVRL